MKKAIIAVIIIISILAAAAVGVTAYASDGYTLPVDKWGERLGITEDKTPEEDDGQNQGDDIDDPGFVVINPMDIELSNDSIGFTNYEGMSEDYIAEYPRTLTATVLPEQTINKELIWSVSFENAQSLWASGKQPEDYIQIEEADDGFSAKVKCVEPFAEPIIITCAVKGNTEVYDTCKVDFYQYVIDYYVDYDGVQVRYTDDTSGKFSADIMCSSGVTGSEHTIDIYYELSDVYTIERIAEFEIVGTFYGSHIFEVDDSALQEGGTCVTFTMDRNLLRSGGGQSYVDKTEEEIFEIVESIGTGILNITGLGLPDIRLKIELNPVSAESNINRDPEDVFVMLGQFINDLTDTGKTFKTIYIPEEINGQAVTNINLSYLDNLETLYIPSQAKGTLSCCDDPKLTTVIIGDNSGLTGTGTGGFCNSENLSVLELGENSIFTEIYDNSFTGTKLQKIELPNDVNIGKGAFANCEMLETVVIGENAVIGESAFNSCSMLKNISIGNNVTLGTSCFSGAGKVSEVVIPEGTIIIASRAFASCPELTKVTIPASVTDIYYRAFMNSGVVTINYLGTKQQWNEINKIAGWDEFMEEYEIVCSDGSLEAK